MHRSLPWPCLRVVALHLTVGAKQRSTKNAQVFNKLLMDNLTRYMNPSQLTELANNDADHRATSNRLVEPLIVEHRPGSRPNLALQAAILNSATTLCTLRLVYQRTPTIFTLN